MLKGFLVTIALIASGAAYSDDICLSVIRKSKLSQVQELTQEQYAQIKQSNAPQFGRFFVAQKRNKAKVGVWTLPYSNGKACVVREVTSL